MRPISCTLILLAALAGCARRAPIDTSVSLSNAWRGFQMKLVRRGAGGQPAPRPPAHLFRHVRYDAPRAERLRAMVQAFYAARGWDDQGRVPPEVAGKIVVFPDG